MLSYTHPTQSESYMTISWKKKAVSLSLSFFLSDRHKHKHRRKEKKGITRGSWNSRDLEHHKWWGKRGRASNDALYTSLQTPSNVSLSMLCQSSFWVFLLCIAPSLSLSLQVLCLCQSWSIMGTTPLLT